MSVKPIKHVYLELEQAVKALAASEPPLEHIQQALSLVADMRVSLNDIEMHVKSLHHSLLACNHFNTDAKETAL